MKKTIITLMAVLTAAMSFAQTLVTPPTSAKAEVWTVTKGAFYAYYSNDYQDVTGYVPSTMNVAIDGSDIYIQGLASVFMPDGWVKGTVSGQKVTVPTGQYLGTDEDGDGVYINGQSVTAAAATDPAVDLVFNYDALAGTLTLDASVEGILVSTKPGVINAAYAFWENFQLTKGEVALPEPVTLPEGVEATDYIFTGTDAFYENVDNRSAQVAIQGTDVYVSGLSGYVPDAWVKGTLSGSTVTFAANQLLAAGFYFSPTADVTMTYDAATGTLTCSYYSTAYQGSTFDEYKDVTLTKVTETAGTPANPQIAVFGEDSYGDVRMGFDVALTDTEGRTLLPSKLTLRFFTETAGQVSPLVFKASDYRNLDADMTDVPYGFTEEYDFFANSIYIYGDDWKQWEKIGIQSVYTGGGETHATDIQWYTIETAGVKAIGAGQGGSERYFDLNGRAVSPSKPGLVIRQIRHADGTVTTRKIINR